MSTADSTYDIPVATDARHWLVPGLLAVLSVLFAVVALLGRDWVLWVPVVLCAAAAAFVVSQVRRARRLNAVRARLSEAGLELIQPGRPARWLGWRDIVGVRSDGAVVEFHLPSHDGAPEGLALATPGSGWGRFAEFTDEVANRLDASRGYTFRVCEFSALDQGGCSNALGCAGHATCQAGGGGGH